MTATILQFPVVSRPVPLEHHPIYRRGVSDFLAVIMHKGRGYPEDRAMAEARRLTALTLDGLPANFGEGEAS